MLEGAAYGSLARGSILTPSQMGILEKVGRTPERLSKIGPKLMKQGAKLEETRGTRAIPLTGRIVGSAMAGESQDANDFSQDRPWRKQ